MQPQRYTQPATVSSLIFPNFLYMLWFMSPHQLQRLHCVPPRLLIPNIKSHNYKIRMENNSSLTDNCWSLAVT